MKSFNLICPIKRKLVMLTLIVSLAFNTSFSSYSNPILPPPLIIEIYFSPQGWQIEMMNSEYSSVYNLDNIWLCGIGDSAQFVTGIEFLPGEVLVVTQDDLMTDMVINQDGDWLTLFSVYENEYWPVDELGLFWGNIPAPPDWYFNRVTAPVGDQSIAVQELYDFEDFCVAKEKPNSIGFSPFEVMKRADFSGVVMDRNDDPLEGVTVNYGGYPQIVTGPDGQFSILNYMFCRIFKVYFMYEGGVIGDTSISIEPDSANYFEFKLDTLLTGIKEIQPSSLQYSIFNIPNPSSSTTTFVVEANHPEPAQAGVIKIYNEAGYIVDIIPVELNKKRQEIVYDFNKKSLSSGMYLYSLESRGHNIASGKMIIQ